LIIFEDKVIQTVYGCKCWHLGYYNLKLFWSKLMIIYVKRFFFIF